ncbi:4-(cytidine 5'-diphospho)-2-C-methyl-D-erythritol kinase [Bifidobacterium sp. UTBIF-78]|uniref:4-(cytidine 5'-diphospho)-2-C-methyl-D-erythritol kinase n=1 Tax=Bifidobacterium sp. UTBIF-78 TaxID=1465263 RepID=UPI0021593F43|nr:4-(cytidine 5'-diphospho)-2-C-methyl-D-erythritol kinase [Bifidobacterium sp. UTBIF-78]TPF95234.1 4-diphosphocytidyl-2C-methyl-D-erythritol kinase [Bifidobacterium sp. UTBIF-78]
MTAVMTRPMRNADGRTAASTPTSERESTASQPTRKPKSDRANGSDDGSITGSITVSVDCPAKTNLTLEVGPVHAEWGGRHELDTIYCAVGVYDTVTASAKRAGTGFSLDLTGAHLGDLAASDSDMRRNHAVLALFAMAKAAGRTPDVALTITKRIPVGAGLGGGSADAAATILAVNRLWGLGWPIERLRGIAATLGADMPFCLTGGFAHGTGYGEQIEDIAFDSSVGRSLIAQGFAGEVLIGAYQSQLRTPDVYRQFDALSARACDAPANRNHLQSAAIDLHPRSGQAIDAAARAGAHHAFVSGSGPSVVAFVADDAVAAKVIDAWRGDGLVDRIIRAKAPAKPIIGVRQ